MGFSALEKFTTAPSSQQQQQPCLLELHWAL